MKKLTIFTALVMVLMVSVNVGAVDLYEDILETPQIENGVQEGQGEYLLNILDMDSEGETIDDGLEHYINFEYGLAENFEVYSNHIAIIENYNSFDLNGKYNFYNDKGYSAAVVGNINYASETTTPGVKVLGAKEINDELTMHANAGLEFGESDMGKEFTAGATYVIDSQKEFRAALNADFIEFDNMSYDLELGLQIAMNEDVTYAGKLYKGLDEGQDNISITNAVEFNAMQDLVLTGQFGFNTSEYVNNNMKAGADYYFNEDYYVTGEFAHTFDYGSNVRMGLGFDM